MNHASILGLPLAVLLATAGLASSLPAETQTFSISRATYTSTKARFECDVELKEDDDATLSLTIPQSEQEVVEASIQSNVPILITTTAVANSGSNKIEVKVMGHSGRPATVTYLRPLELSDAVRVRHEIDLTPGQPTRLSSFLTIQDWSASDASWSKADFLVDGEGLLFEFPVTMQPKQHFSAPIGNLQAYQIGLHELGDSIVAIDENSAYSVGHLSNRGKHTIPGGTVQVFAKDRLLYTTQIDRSIAPLLLSSNGAIEKGGMIRLQAIPTSQVAVGSVLETERWHEAVSLSEGLLIVRTHQATVVTIHNRTPTQIQAYLPEASTPVQITAGVKQEFATDTTANTPNLEADLADLNAETLKLHVEHLGDLQIHSQDASAETLSAARQQLTRIQAHDSRMTARAKSKEVIQKRLDELSGESPDPVLAAKLYRRLGTLQEEIEQERSDRAASVRKLLEVLFPTHASPAPPDATRPAAPPNRPDPPMATIGMAPGSMESPVEADPESAEEPSGVTPVDAPGTTIEPGDLPAPAANTSN
ncbi:hypothetical protein [Rhodopirellula islandica]|nr:hypothetical protein [Rhodopirellula islandica]